MNAPAFKEWLVIVNALSAGEQILILRKGGISEGRGGFRISADRFWLFPTLFHAQREKTKPSSEKWLAPAGDSATVTLRAFADIADSAFLTNWEDVARLDAFHLWTETAIRERFDWSRLPGIHALVVRVHRLNKPITVAVTPEMGGCKSWLDLPHDFTAFPSAPVLDDLSFSNRRTQLGL